MALATPQGHDPLLSALARCGPAARRGRGSPRGVAGDRPGDPTQAALAALAERFNPRVADLVRAVTNPAQEPGRDWFEQYREHVAESLDRNPWARVIKVSDFTDNGGGVIHADGPKQLSAATKYRPLVSVFRDLVARADTPLSDEVKAHILGQLDVVEERFDAILGNT